MNDFPYTITQAPANLPVSLDNVKAWLKIDVIIPSQEALLTELIKAATIFAQSYMGGLILINTTFTTYRNCFYKTFLLKRAPLQTVNHLKYYLDGTVETLDPSNYYKTVHTGFSKIVFNDYPDPIDIRLQAIEIEFIAGFGATEADIPDDLQIAIKSHVAAMFENRGDCDDSRVLIANITDNLPLTSKAIYMQRRLDSVLPYNEF